MTKEQLNQKLTDSLKAFSDDIHSKYSEGSKEPITESDLHEVSRDVFYLMDDFRKYIIEYLE